MSPQMRIGLGQFNELTDEKLAFIKQLGADDFLMNTPRLPAISNGSMKISRRPRIELRRPGCG